MCDRIKDSGVRNIENRLYVAYCFDEFHISWAVAHLVELSSFLAVILPILLLSVVLLPIVELISYVAVILPLLLLLHRSCRLAK
jgi:hypothetical protein